jgi:hypothetical protein
MQADELADAGFRVIVEADLLSGHHRNPTNNPEYFATAYLHLLRIWRTR